MLFVGLYWDVSGDDEHICVCICVYLEQLRILLFWDEREFSAANVRILWKFENDVLIVRLFFCETYYFLLENS